MKQLDLFNQLSTEDLIEDLIQEPIERYFIQTEKPHMKYCKVLTASKVYDVTIFNDQAFQSIINHAADRNKHNKYFLKAYFDKFSATKFR